jgi:hypothetical protein
LFVSITRILNEDDVVEAFVRHSCAQVDHMLLLDNGSIDRTVDILRALHAEGLPITVLRAVSVVFDEEEANSVLYRAACDVFHPSWVICLDADEFLDVRGPSLRETLMAVAAATPAVTVTLRNYVSLGNDYSDLLVPRRMVLRDATDRGVAKQFIRGGIDGTVTLSAGNHSAWIGGILAGSLPLETVALAHYPSRHPLQGAVKAVLGRIKVLARGGGADAVAQTANHYIPFLDIMCRDPALLLHADWYMENQRPAFAVVEDPIRYAGGDLRYTVASDPAMKALRCLGTALERLAASHGRLLDADPVARARVTDEGLRVERVV